MGRLWAAAGKDETHAEPRVCYTDGRSEFPLHGGDVGDVDLQEMKRSIMAGPSSRFLRSLGSSLDPKASKHMKQCDQRVDKPKG